MGQGRAYRLPAVSPPVARRLRIRGLTCRSDRAGRLGGAHLELYARRLVLPLPAGIGIAQAGACTYPVRTDAPTGIVRFERGPRLTVADLFAVWGQPLSRRRLAGFHGGVVAYVGGRRWPRPAGAIVLRRHEEIVLEVAGYVPPHPTYLFPPGV